MVLVLASETGALSFECKSLFWEQLKDPKDFLISEQEFLFREFHEMCMPSAAMNEHDFKIYMMQKGLKDEKIHDTFRWEWHQNEFTSHGYTHGYFSAPTVPANVMHVFIAMHTTTGLYLLCTCSCHTPLHFVTPRVHVLKVAVDSSGSPD